MNYHVDFEIKNYGSYVVCTKRGIERGLFFRSPIQKVEYDAFYEGRQRQNAWDYSAKLKNPFRRLFEIIIGNRKIVDNIEVWKQQINWAGFKANKICSPIYLKREYRSLGAYSQNPELNIQTIESHGYESLFGLCDGTCMMGKITIKTKSGKVIKLKHGGRYHYTYEHIVCNMLGLQ